MLLATEQQRAYSGYQTQPVALNHDAGLGFYYLEFEVGGSSGSKIINFHPPSTVSLSNSGHSNASLPAINLFADPTFVNASYISDATGNIFQTKDVKSGQDPTEFGSYSLPSGLRPTNVYFAPKDLSTKELLIDGGLAFQNTDVDVLANVPASGTVQGSNYFWQSSDGGMGPILRTVPKSFEEDQARDEFLSGVALATAAAALIALIQAGPKRLWPTVGRSYRLAARERTESAQSQATRTPPLGTAPVDAGGPTTVNATFIKSQTPATTIGIAVAVVLAAHIVRGKRSTRTRAQRR